MIHSSFKDVRVPEDSDASIHRGVDGAIKKYPRPRSPKSENSDLVSLVNLVVFRRPAIGEQTCRVAAKRRSSHALVGLDERYGVRTFRQDGLLY
jgi:hypothetical protein